MTDYAMVKTDLMIYKEARKRCAEAEESCVMATVGITDKQDREAAKRLADARLNDLEKRREEAFEALKASIIGYSGIEAAKVDTLLCRYLPTVEMILEA